MRSTQIDPSISLQIQNITDTSNPENQFHALSQIYDAMDEEYSEQLRLASFDDLTAFAEYINRDEPPAPHHIWMCEKLEAMEARELERLMVSMPPGHAKSTYCSKLFPAWYLGRNPRHKYIQAGHTQGFCENNFGKPVRAIVSTDEFQGVFDDVELSTESKAADSGN